MSKRKKIANSKSYKANNQNPWDIRKPSMYNWWEAEEISNNTLSDTMSTSSIAKLDTNKWLEQRLIDNNDERKKNIKQEFTKKNLDFSKICRIIPVVDKQCQRIIPIPVIKSSVYSLTDAVCRLYDRWINGTSATGPEFFYALFSLVGRLIQLIKDFEGTNGTCDQLALLTEHYDECLNGFRKLLTQLNDTHFSREMAQINFSIH